MEITYFLSGLILGFPNAAVPGPFQAYLLSQALSFGWKKALPIALAPLLSDGPIIALVLFVLSRMSEQTLGFIQIAGGIFILYLAFGAYRSIQKTGSDRFEKEKREVGIKGVFKGALMNALNPAPYIFWGTVGGPMLLNGWRESAAIGVAFLVGFYGTLIFSFAVLIRLFGAAGSLHPRAKKVLGWVSVAALLAFGIWQLAMGTNSIM